MAKKNKQEKKSDESLGSRILSAFFLILIVVVWLGILAALIKLDVGGFGSTMLRPILKDVPVLNKILPEMSEEELEKEAQKNPEENPIATLSQAREMIEQLQEENEALTKKNKKLKEEKDDLTKQVERLKVFEDNQNQLQQEKEKFYKEIVYGENAPDADTYIEWYERIDAANAEAIYRQLISGKAAQGELAEVSKTYESMKPKEAAAVLEKMSYDMNSVVEILKNMKADSRAKIMDQMSPDFAALVTKKLMP